MFPGDLEAQLGIKKKLTITPEENDNDHLEKVKLALEESIPLFKPDFIIYNAGIDCIEGDPLGGGLHITSSGVVCRDELVFKFAVDNKIPILMLLSGGFHTVSAATTILSIENVIKKFNLLEMKNEKGSNIGVINNTSGALIEN